MATTSPKFSLNWRDLLEGLLMAAVSPALLMLASAIAAGRFTINWTEEWHVAASAGATFLLKTFFSGPSTSPVGSTGVTKVLVLWLGMSSLASPTQAQFQWGGPFSAVKKTTFSSLSRSLTPVTSTLNTFKVSVSLPGYWYSGADQQRAVVGLGYTFEHYAADALIYSIGPYVWYDTPIPTGATKLPVGYGAAGTYKGIVLLGILTPDAVHWGPVLSLNFSFGSGGISL